MINELITRYPSLVSCKAEIGQAVQAIIACYEKGGKVMTCGNGGSCADADHMVGELMKGFLKKRPLSDKKKRDILARCPNLDQHLLCNLQGGLPAISLCSFTALNSAFCNDVDPELIYAQSVSVLGNPEDILICMSTSGNAKNVFAAAQIAKALGITVIGLTGMGGGKLCETADICIRVPEDETYKVQELHLPVYHYLCAATESYFFPA